MRRVWLKEKSGILWVLFEIPGDKYMEIVFLDGRISNGNKRIRLRYTRFNHFWGKIIYDFFPYCRYDYADNLVYPDVINKYTGPHYLTGPWK